MSKLSKFYVSQSTRSSHPDSGPSTSPAPHFPNGQAAFPCSNGQPETETLERIPNDEEALLVESKEEAYSVLPAGNETIPISVHRQQHALQEINHLRNHLAELRRQFSENPGQNTRAFEQPLSNLEYHLGILARTFTE